MIKNSTYIRRFTSAQRMQLVAIQKETKIKSTTDIIMFAVGQYADHIAEIARLKRLIEYKKRQIERLQAK